MLDQGATEREVESYLASEGVTAQDLRGHMPPEDEQAYTALAADPQSTAADLQAFARQRGFDVTAEDAATFIAARGREGAKVGGPVQYRGADPAPAAYPAEGPALPTGSNTWRQSLRAVAGDVLDGALPGAAKFVRGTRGVTDNALGALFSDEAFDPSSAYAEAAADQELAQARFNADHPNWATALGTGGAVAGLFAMPGVRLLKGPGLARGLVNSAATGAAYGGLSGALTDAGGGRLENAGYGALAGGALGAAAPIAVHRGAEAIATARRNLPGFNEVLTAAENVGRRVMGREPLQPTAAAHAQAERLLRRTMDDATIDAGMGAGSVPATPANIAEEVARRQALGTPAMPADVAEPLRGSLSSAVRSEGRMATRARGVLSARQAQQGQRIRGALAAELGDAVDPIAAANAITSRARAAAEPLYRQAYAQPVVVTPEMAAIMQTPAFRDALPQAVRNIRNAGREPTSLGFQLDAAGNITGLETLSSEGMDQVVRAMKDSARAAAGSHPITGQPIHNTNSVHINARAKDLQEQLAAQNPAYADAVSGYADEMAIRDALDRGSKVASLSGPEIAAQARAIPQHAQEAWAAGARTALADQATATGLRPGTNGALSMRASLGLSGAGLTASAGDTAKREAIEAITSRPGVLGRLDDRLEAESQAHRTFSAAAGGVSRPDVGEGLGAVEAAGTVLRAAGKASQGRFMGALSDVILRGNPRGTAAFRGALDDRTAELLSAVDPQEARGAMEAVEGRRAADRVREGVLTAAGSTLGRTGVLYAAGQSQDYSPSTDPAWESPAAYQPIPGAPLMPLPIYSRR
jgi:hypothetical protein